MWPLLVFAIILRESRGLEPKHVNPGVGGEVRYPNRPHIIILMADDMGFNDVSFRGSSQILTPNIDALGYQGVILNRHYVPYLCTPSRAALLTGMYPVHTGMQHFVIRSCEPYGLPLNLTLLPQYLKMAGYQNHLVGKWHLGHFKKKYTPMQRGFDSFFGFYTGALHFYDHTYSDENGPIGYDFRRNEDVTYEGYGEYATYLFTNESLRVIRDHNPDNPLFLMTTYNAPHASAGPIGLVAPQEEIDKITYINDPEVRIYAAMVAIMDRGIGQIIRELSLKKMLSNSVILFYADNGAPTEGFYETTGSNYPFRGQKYSPWEGGSRVPAVLWSPLMEVRHGVFNHLIHNTDWLPTFLAMTGIQPQGNLDGFDIWPALMKNLPSPRTEIIYNIDPIDQVVSFYYKGWKFVNGTTSEGKYDTWLGTCFQEKSAMESKYLKMVRNTYTWQALSPFARTLTDRSIKRIKGKARVACQPRVPYAVACNPLQGPCLFRINEDPCEINNLALIYPFQTYLMEILLRKYKAETVYPINLPNDYEGCDPRKYNGTFTSWLD